MAGIFGASGEISTLPENLLLDVFSYLPIKDLCTVGRVCRKWRRVTADNTLWRHVDLHPYKLNLGKMWKVIRAHFSEVLISLHIRGFTHPGGANLHKHSLSPAMMKDLSSRSPNIRELDLLQCNLGNLDSSDLPHKLQTLKIRHSLLLSSWFEVLKENSCHQTLTSVDLTDSTMTSASHIKLLSCLSTLTSLKVNRCYRITESAVDIIAESFPQLETLEISGTKCTDIALHNVGRKCCKLRRLDLSRCSQITDSGLAEVSCLKQLEWLRLQDCEGITDTGVGHLDRLVRLVTCDLTGCGVTQSSVDKLRLVLTNCQVIFTSNTPT